MAWRPTRYLLEGELENTTPGKVTGWMKFAGMKSKVTFDLKGDFHRDIRGTRIRLTGDGQEEDAEAASYMDSFAQHQTGNVGDITAGLLWRFKDGKMREHMVPRPTKWKSLKKEAAQKGKTSLPLKSLSHWLPYYLIVFPNRFYASAVLPLDDALNH